MTVQSVSNVYQSHNSVRSDFTNLSTDVNALQSALSSGNQDQVTLSEGALTQQLSQVLSDISNTPQGQSAGSSNVVQSTGNSSMQNLVNDLQTLENALTSMNQTQGTSSTTATSST